MKSHTSRSALTLAGLAMLLNFAMPAHGQGLPPNAPFITNFTATATPIPPPPPDPAGPKVPKINTIAVGYDIQNNTAATRMLQDIVSAATNSGAKGKLIIAGQSSNELSQAMGEAMTIASQKPPPPPPQPPTPPLPPPQPPPSAVSLTLKTTVAKAGEKLIVQHSPIQNAVKSAWIGFYRGKDAKSEDYLAYTFLNNLTDRTYDVEAPDQPGMYHFRLFLDKGYDPAAVSGEIEVK